MPEQLPLDFQFQSNFRFSNYFTGCNTEIITHLHTFLHNPQEQQIYLWGEPGLGKTHLLQACCHSMEDLAKTSFYFNLKLAQSTSTTLLEGLETIDLVCLDDIDQISGNRNWEHSLFNFYNRHRANNKQLLVSANRPPQHLPLQLADLKTRMAWGLTLKLRMLDEQQIIQALNQRAHTLGFHITTPIGKFLLAHYAHDLPSLWALLAKIDHATLAAKRKLTIPFLKQIMQSTDE